VGPAEVWRLSSARSPRWVQRLTRCVPLEQVRSGAGL